MSDLIIVKELLSFDAQFAAGFYDTDGWDREPVTRTSNTNPMAIGMIFCPSSPELSITGWFDRHPVAMSSANSLSYHLDCFPDRITKTAEKFANDKNTMKFVNLQRDISDFEHTKLLDYLDKKDISANDVAHRSGLMVMENYQGRGFAKKLIQESDKYLREKGFKAVVVSPSWEGSRNIFIKEGYKLLEKFYLNKYGINMINPDDYNSYMIKIF